MAVKIALVGNPNCGKTTMFNNLTGANQYVGNWPGVTVEKKEGKLKGYNDVIVTDLPGIYSLSPYTLEEVVSRNYILNEHPDVILNLVDGSNIERNLYLTTQLLEMGVPVVIAMNMIDIVRKNGDKIDIEALGKKLGCPIVETSALSGLGLKEAAAKAVELAKARQVNTKPLAFNADVEKALDEIKYIMGSALPEKGARWTLIKLFERDREVWKKYNLPDVIQKQLEKIIGGVEDKLDDDCESIITSARYDYITGLMESCVKKAKTGMTTSDKIDRIVTNRILALPIFAFVMFIVYYLAVTTIGTDMTDWTNDVLFGEIIMPGVQEAMESAGAAEWQTSLVVDGIIGGLGAPIGFVPQMAVMFFLLAILEDCGYMARIAFIMDRIFHKFGLSGKSFIPFLISAGCGVPGILATRTIETETDRRMTIMTTTFIPCGAKLPVIALIAGAIMGGDWYMAPIMYFIGVISVIFACLILKKTEMFAGDPAPFVMELPQYHFPSVKNVLLHTWERCFAFIKKVATVLFLVCVVMWYLSTYGIGAEGYGMVEPEDSFIAAMGGAIAWIFAPLGFGEWQAVAASISGFVAKEAIVSTIGVLIGVGELAEDDASLWQATMGMFQNPMAAFSFLVFNLLDSPCLAAITTMNKELGSRKWLWFAIIFQNVFAYAMTFLFYQFGLVLIMGEPFSGMTAIACVVAVIMLYMMFRPAPKAKAALRSVNA